jgi:hypothetical protein
MHAERRVLLRLTTGDPLLVERRVGHGTSLLFASSPNRDWNNMAVSPVYPVLLQRAVTHLLRRANETPLTAGAALAIPLPGDAVGTALSVVGPDSRVREARTEAIDGRSLADAGKAEQCGFYEFRQTDGGGAVRAVAVNADHRESDIRPLGAAALESVLADVTEAVVLTEADDIAAAIREGRVGRELWRIFAVAAVGILILESLIAKRTTRHRQRPITA